MSIVRRAAYFRSLGELTTNIPNGTLKMIDQTSARKIFYIKIPLLHGGYISSESFLSLVGGHPDYAKPNGWTSIKLKCQ